MGIIYNEKARTFTLHTHNTTYQMQIDAYGFLLRSANCRQGSWSIYIMEERQMELWTIF